MDIYEMHVLFRTLGQQQGLQLVRGILAESIDEFLYEAIIQLVRVVILGNAQGSKDIITPQYTKISELNSLHTLYCSEESAVTQTNDGDVITIQTSNIPFCVTNFVLKTKNNKKYDCRVIESERLYQTLNDYLNHASLEYPIVSLANNNADNKFDIYLFTGDKQKDVASIITSYIRMPSKVHLDEEHYGQGESDTSISCDLPVHLHQTVVETAVELWFQTLGLTSKQPQEQQSNKNS